jgi:hypothetical protein
VSWRRTIGLGRRQEPDSQPDQGEPDDQDWDQEQQDYQDQEEEQEEELTQDDDRERPASRWRRILAAGPEGNDNHLKPSAMRGNEMLYGYLIVGELILVSILNLTVTHGKGAPAHPSRVLEIIGLLASIGLLAVLQTRHRFIAPFAMIIVAYVIAFPKTPESLTLAHLFALVLPVIYAFVLMQRQRKASLALARNPSGGGRAPRSTPEERRAEAIQRRQERHDRRRGIAPSTGPKRSSRYTPPKTRRPKH